MAKEIPLTQGKVAIVDDEDFDFLMQWKWYFSGRYAVRAIKTKGKVKTFYMHKIVVDIDAARAYDKAATKYHGEFAFTNALI